MSLVDTYRRVQGEKGSRERYDSMYGPRQARLKEVAALGEEWTTRMFAKHDLGVEDFVEIASDIAEVTIPDLLRMVDAGVLTIEEFGKACIGAGASTGLIVGLEHRS